MGDTIYRPESRCRASEVRAKIRRSLNLDILSRRPHWKVGWIMRPWVFSHDGSCEKLPTAKIFCRTIETCWLAPGQRFRAGSKNRWLGSPHRIPIVSTQQDRLDLLDLGVWPRPKSSGSFCGMEVVRCSVVVDLFCFVFQPQVSYQVRDSRVEPWGGATGQPEIWLKMGPRDMSSPL